MNELPRIFFDDGGVLNDNKLRAPQWKALIAEFFVPRFGGSVDQWKKANEMALNQFLNTHEERYANRTDYDYIKMWEREDILWLNVMFEHVGISLPPTQDKLSLAREAQEWITRRVKTAFPGIIAVVESLWKMHYPLYTASAEPSWTLKGYLKGMGILSYFTELYGPDLVQTPKGGTIYYKRIFSHAGVHPKKAIVVDDSPTKLAMADEIGANAIQSCVTGEFEPEFPLYYYQSGELLDLILKIS